MICTTLRTTVTVALLVCLLAACNTTSTGAQNLPTSVPAPTAVQPTPTALVVAPTAAPQRQVISGIGTVRAVREADLGFSVTGTVAQVLVKRGDVVTASQVLAQLDPRRFEQGVRQAEAALRSAKAQVAALNTPPRSSAVAAARAQVRQAEIAVEQARVEQTQDARTVDAAVASADAALQDTRDKLSAVKTNAELTLQQTTNTLTQAQSDYATAKSNWEYVQETGADPTMPRLVDPSSGKKEKNKLNDVQKQQYYDAFVKADSALRSAEAGVQQAQVAFDNARQAEVTGIAQAEQGLAQAQAARDKLRLPENVDRVAAAQTGVDTARANLQQLYPRPTGAERETVGAGVQQAEATLEQARLDLDSTLLRAPFDGVIAAVNIDPGDASASAADAPIRIVDLHALHIDVQISDVDIGRVTIGQTARVFIEAAPGTRYAGTVSFIAPTASIDGTRRTYLVQVTLDNTRGLRPGMSARVEIVAQS